MIEFFNTKVHKARIHHKCEYCEKDICPGEEYERCSGKMYADFFDYCLCLRCSTLLEYLHGGEEYEIGRLRDEICNSGILDCPICKGGNFRQMDYSPDMQSVKILCGDCNSTYTVDISEDAIQRHIENELSKRKRLKIKAVNGECEYLIIVGQRTERYQMDVCKANLLIKNGNVEESELFAEYPICVNNRFYFAKVEESED